jgi:hypothetical protein
MKRLLAWGILVLFLIGSAGVTPSSAGRFRSGGKRSGSGKTLGRDEQRINHKAFNAFLSRPRARKNN